MNRCRHVQGKVVAGERLTETERKHVVGCDGCGRIAQLHERFSAMVEACSGCEPEAGAVVFDALSSGHSSVPALLRAAWLAAGLAALAVLYLVVTGPEREANDDMAETSVIFEMMDKLERYQQQLWEVDEDVEFVSYLSAGTVPAGVWDWQEQGEKKQQLPESVAVFELWFGEEPL